MTLRAYARKDEMGGGFRAVVVDRRNGNARYESDVLPTYESARNWAMSTAHRLMGDTPYRRASVNNKRSGRRYDANIWAY
jgi:hypothetical protein